MTVTAIPSGCKKCGAPLRAHNITRLCQECKCISRNKRMSASYDDTGQVTLAQAVAHIVAILGGRVISERDT
jgi:hypothetical protein